MLSVSSVLGQMIERYYSGLTANHASRVIVPGLTEKIAQEVHEVLAGKGLPVYLVIGNEQVPDENKRYIQPIGLTSKRLGSFIAITCPGQLSQLQDSVRGTGGTVRSILYSEEWPWIDEAVDVFHFDYFLGILVGLWTNDPQEKQWLIDFVKNAIVRGTETVSSRTELLLERILGTFSPDLYPEISDVRLKMLFHTGVPCPSGQVPPVNSIVSEMTKLCKSVLERCADESDIRVQLRDLIPELFPQDATEVTRAVDSLLDNLGKSAILNEGILSFYGCWSEKPSYWLSLDEKKLEALFQVRRPRVSTLSCTMSAPLGLVSEDSKVIATFVGDVITVAYQFSIPEEEFNAHSWSIRLSSRKSRLHSDSISEREGSGEFRVSTEEWDLNYAKPLPMRVGLFADEEPRAYFRFAVHLCGAARPSIVLVDPYFVVCDPRPSDESESFLADKVESSEPVHLYMLSAEQEPQLEDDNGRRLQVVVAKERIWRTPHRLDPGSDPTGQITRVCVFGEKQAVICLEAKDVVFGAFTIEEELIVSMTERKNSNLKQLLGLFAGHSREPYPRLGGLDAASRRRVALANHITTSDGWRPYLVNHSFMKATRSPRPQELVFVGEGVDASGFRNISLPIDARNVLHLYAEKRSTCLELIKGHLGAIVLEHPVYATHPIYIDSKSVEIECAIVDYLEAYLDLLNYAKEYRANLNWSQLFIMTYVDCIVEWNNKIERNRFALLGPWHPVVLAQRYMVQSAIFKRVMALEEHDGELFRHMAVMMKEVSGFRWFAGLNKHDSLWEGMVAFPTNDPGWHLVVAQEIMDERGGDCVNVMMSLLRDNLGLEISSLSKDVSDLLGMSVRSYLRAFPSRRSIAVAVNYAHSQTDLIESAVNLLHSTESNYSLGHYLKGGLHLHFPNTLPDNMDIELPTIETSVLVYNESRGSSQSGIDIQLADSSVGSAFREGLPFEKLSVPRGHDLHAAFAAPLLYLTDGQAQLPNSISLQFDLTPGLERDLGGMFVTVLCQLCQMLRAPMVQIQTSPLPQQLDTSWLVVPGRGIDPGVLVKYAQEASTRDEKMWTLWDYRHDITGSENSFYIISSISPSFVQAVNGFFDDTDVARTFVRDLGTVGIAIGGEALKSGRHALGVIGLVGAVRLLQENEQHRGVFNQDARSVGFLIPVDSFLSFFGTICEDAGNERHKRSDLLAIQLVIPQEPCGPLVIYACGVEAKFVSGTYSIAMANAALEQAKASTDQFKKLVRVAKQSWAIPERLGLLALLRFGLRITSPNRSENENLAFERRIFEATLRGEFCYRDGATNAVLVTTEGRLTGAPEFLERSGGWWVRLNKENWPGVKDTVYLDRIRDSLGSLFATDETDSNTEREETRSVLADGELASDESPELNSADVEHIERDNLEHADSGAFALESQMLEKIMLGVTEGRVPVFWDPQSRTESLDNLNVMVTGSAGKGKTQLIKYLICCLRSQGKNALIMDFKNDFAIDAVFTEKAELERIFVGFDGLPFNPLIPYPVRHPLTGEPTIQIAQHITGLASILQRTYGLGPQQQMAVKNAIDKAFRDEGLRTIGSYPYDPNIEYPDFFKVGAILAESNANAYNRLDPLFSLDLFRSKDRKISFESLVNRALILSVNDIPSDQIKSTLAELIMFSAHAYFNSLPHSGRIRQMIVLDEAHRVMGSNATIQFVRECRAYGVGMVLSSQYPTDFPAEVSGSMATKIIHSNDRNMDLVRAIVQLVGCTGRESEVANLNRFEALVDNRHNRGVFIRTMNYPAYLVYSYLQHSGRMRRSSIRNVPGLMADALSIESILTHLEQMGLIHEVDGFIELVSQ